MKKASFILCAALIIQGCASSPSGSNWATADFNKYDKNYASFPTAQIKIGQPKSELITVLGEKFDVVEAGEGYEVISYQKWKSAAGPDYVEQTLYVRLVDNRVKNWKLTHDTVEVVPMSW
ncbi:MAG: hypothetical protein ACKVN9_05935 [Methylophilaceae bacterium]